MVEQIILANLMWVRFLPSQPFYKGRIKIVSSLHTELYSQEVRLGSRLDARGSNPRYGSAYKLLRIQEERKRK